MVNSDLATLISAIKTEHLNVIEPLSKKAQGIGRYEEIRDKHGQNILELILDKNVKTG